VLHVRVWRSQIRDIDGVAVVGWGAAGGRQARQAEGEVPRSAGGGSLVRPGRGAGPGTIVRLTQHDPFIVLREIDGSDHPEDAPDEAPAASRQRMSPPPDPGDRLHEPCGVSPCALGSR
jgi:hypothetical protein